MDIYIYIYNMELSCSFPTYSSYHHVPAASPIHPPLPLSPKPSLSASECRKVRVSLAGVLTRLPVPGVHPAWSLGFRVEPGEAHLQAILDEFVGVSAGQEAFFVRISDSGEDLKREEYMARPCRGGGLRGPPAALTFCDNLCFKLPF